MNDRSKFYLKLRADLNKLPTLEGKKVQFDSMAEMILTRAQEIPDRVHVLFYDEVITYAQTNERSNKVANYLKAKGVKKGDICSVMILNSPEIYYTMFGIQKLGAIAGAINFMLKGPEIAYVLDDSKPKAVFVSTGFMEEFARGYAMAQHKPIVIEVKQDGIHNADIAEGFLTDILDTYPADEAFVPQKLEDPFLLLYSSGTTGLPKGILLPNRAQHSINKDMARSQRGWPGDVVMIVTPMFHTNPLCVWTYPYIYQGLTFCIRKRFSPDDWWPAIARYGVKVCWAVPAMYNYVLYKIDPATIEHDKIVLRDAFSGGAPVPTELIRDFKDKFRVQIFNGYGLTEACGVSSSSFGAPYKPGAIGQALYEQEIQIRDVVDGSEAPFGAIGEICIKGPAIMLGYLNKPEATAATIKDGWLHTGDLGRMDEEGYVFYDGRLKEMINRGGENIYPREIEIPLEAHPRIRDVAVVGQPDPALGERVKACIVLVEPGSMTADEVKEYLSDKIAKYKIPEIVEFLDDFPRNPTGKVLKNKLKGAKSS